MNMVRAAGSAAAGACGAGGAAAGVGAGGAVGAGPTEVASSMRPPQMPQNLNWIGFSELQLGHLRMAPDEGMGAPGGCGWARGGGAWVA
jgi:hypothetical protein